MLRHGPQCIKFIDELGQLKRIRDNLVQRMGFFVDGKDKSGNFLATAKEDGQYLYGELPRMMDRIREAKNEIKFEATRKRLMRLEEVVDIKTGTKIRKK